MPEPIFSSAPAVTPLFSNTDSIEYDWFAATSSFALPALIEKLATSDKLKS